ncbi:MAG: cyanophycinase [Saprospiraceae bacterium]|nr:cyanophycinase [Saprospiraceae bacterium]
MNVKGILIPIGGNEDKGIVKSEKYTLEYINSGILSRVVKESGGIHASIVIIPTASSIPDEVIVNYTKAFQKLGCTDVYIMDIRLREQSEDPEHIDMIKKADCVMFSGGDQSKITGNIGGSTIHKILLKRFQNDKIVIAGTSAGAMCMSGEMITGGNSSESFFKGAVGMAKGMCFIDKLIIDSHFITRGRFGRLAEAVARHPTLIGIGLADDTGLVIKNGNDFEVIGSGMVIIFDPNKLQHNNIEILEDGTPMTITNLTTHVLANGDRFNIEKRAVKVLPMEADFVKLYSL